MALPSLLIELEKTELREALGDGCSLSELDSSDARPFSSDLRTGRMVEAMRLGSCGVVGAEDSSLPFTPLAMLVGIELTVPCEAEESVDRDAFRPCKKVASLLGADLGELEACA